MNKIKTLFVICFLFFQAPVFSHAKINIGLHCHAKNGQFLDLPFCCSYSSSLDKEKKLYCEQKEPRTTPGSEIIYWETIQSIKAGFKSTSQTAYQRAKEQEQATLKNMAPEELKDPEIHIGIYRCPSPKTVLYYEIYGEEFFLLIQYKEDSYLSYNNFSKTARMISAHKEALFQYMCKLNPHTFYKTLQTPHFDFNLESPAEKQDNITKNISSTNETELTALPLMPSTQEQKTPSKATPLPEKSSAWNVLGDYFYPADVPGNLSNMRRFETKNKSKEIKINFSSKDKQPFLEKLKTAHRYHPARQTDCADSSILYETVSDGIYQAYVLSENAITVFSAAYNLPTLPEEPHAARMQKEFCTLDVSSKW